MNLIEQLGGYDEAKKQGEEWGFDDHLSNALLEYRREHDIYETLDKVVLVGSGTTDVLLEIIDFKHTNDLYRVRVLSTGSMGPLHRDNMRHATPEEIAAGYRLN